MRPGAFTFVLHSHLPWVRRAGRWPFGEEWLYQALLDTYLPLADIIGELCDEGIAPAITLGVTPVLIEMLGDPYMLAQFDTYLEERLAVSARDVARFREGGDARLHLAELYVARYERAHYRWHHVYGRDIISALRAFAQRGAIEIITSAATHGYLPLLATDSSIRAQLRVGIASTQRAFGIDPKGIWLPECAYRGAYLTADGTRRAGIDEFLAELGITYFFTDAHAITGAHRVGRESLGSSGLNFPKVHLIGHHFAETGLVEVVEDEGRSTLVPYKLPNSGVAAFARNQLTSLQVWSREIGYPGDGIYREFHKRDEKSGNLYWRITSATTELNEKELYDAEGAAERLQSHAAHFAGLVAAILTRFEAENPGIRPILTSPFDTELFGHWWSEGPAWIAAVLRRLHGRDDVALESPSAYLATAPANHMIDLPESSWGEAGDHRVWFNDRTAWLWPIVHECERRMERLAARRVRGAKQKRLLAQAARELLLLQSSDWPFLITTGQARRYAVERFETHVARFRNLADAIDGTNRNRSSALIEASYDDDTLFADVDPALFAATAQEQPRVGLVAAQRPLIASLA